MTEYCMAVKIEGTTHRVWGPRKGELTKLAKALAKIGKAGAPVEAVLVGSVNQKADQNFFAWGLGAETLF